MSSRFLVVDDVQASRKLVCRLISSSFPEAEIAETSNGKDALLHIRTHQPDIIVLDVLMPDMDGFEVCRQIKSDPETSRTLVMMVSGYLTDSRSRTSGLHSGADAYICKPFEKDEFIAQLRALERIRQVEKSLHDEQKQLLAELNSRKIIEKQLESAKQAAESAVRAKSEFLAHMSHEIRTPMNAVIGMTEILLDSELNTEQRDCLETIHTASETLLMVINDILDHSKIESGKLKLESRSFSLTEMIDDAVRMARPEAVSKGLRLSVKIAPSVPVQVIGDTIRLRQILSNLLNNAVKFTERGDVDIEVSACRINRGAYQVHFIVRDSGVGIPPDKIDRLFQPFSQVDDSTTRRYGGTGLGLVISQRLARLMQGDVSVESNLGSGSAFHVRVCLFPDDGSKDSADRLTPTTAFEGKRCLVVSADAEEQRLLTEWCASWGMEVFKATGIQEACDLCAHTGANPHVIIVSENANLDGIECARALHSLFDSESAPAMLLLSITDPDPSKDVNLFMAQLHKPLLDASPLFDMLHEILWRPSPAISKEEPPSGSPPLCRVLVAEDNPVNRKVAEYMLKRLNCEYDFAEDGRAAVAAAREQSYDLILMDVQMPHMDGVEAMQAIRKECEAGSCPYIVALTAHAMQGDREKYIAEGMDDYISKPIKEKALKQVMEASLRHSQRTTGS